MMIRLSDLKARTKGDAETFDYIKMNYPEEVAFLEKLDIKIQQETDLIYSVDVEKTISDTNVWVDDETGEVEYE